MNVVISAPFIIRSAGDRLSLLQMLRDMHSHFSHVHTGWFDV